MAAPEGYKALGKIGISYKGEYASNTAYERLDAVYHNGSTYLAIKDAPDGAPRDDKINWIYLAKGFDSDIGDYEITFTEAETRANIDTGESVKTVFGRVKKWFDDLAAAAFMQVITSYADLMAGTSITNYLVNAKAVQDGFSEVNSNLSSIGKKLWSGSFTEGTITVPGLSAYTIYVVYVGTVACFGDCNYGIGGYGEYGNYPIHTQGYRFTSNKSLETLTIDSINKGGSNGIENVAVTAIYGLF